MSTTLSGGDWIAGTQTGVAARWGHDDRVLWASGESMILSGPPGVGKTTLLVQLTYAMLGLLAGPVLGLPVAAAERVLYLAADRPHQIARAFRRLYDPAHLDVLNERLRVAPGPPPENYGKAPDALLRLARREAATVIIVDSLKDVAIGLTNDDIGAGINRMMQSIVADGRDLLVSHHQRKSGAAMGTKPRHLEDLYGSAFIAAGAGSVALLWGKAGDEIVELSHLKSPALDVGPLTVEHDHSTGLSLIHEHRTVPGILSLHPGSTTTEVAKRLYGVDDPTDAQRKRVHRKLVSLGAAVTKLDRPGILHGAQWSLAVAPPPLSAVDTSPWDKKPTEDVDDRERSTPTNGQNP